MTKRCILSTTNVAFCAFYLGEVERFWIRCKNLPNRKMFDVDLSATGPKANGWSIASSNIIIYFVINSCKGNVFLKNTQVRKLCRDCKKVLDYLAISEVSQFWI